MFALPSHLICDRVGGVGLHQRRGHRPRRMWCWRNPAVTDNCTYMVSSAAVDSTGDSQTQMGRILNGGDVMGRANLPSSSAIARRRQADSWDQVDRIAEQDMSYHISRRPPSSESDAIAPHHEFLRRAAWRSERQSAPRRAFQAWRREVVSAFAIRVDEGDL